MSMGFRRSRGPHIGVEFISIMRQDSRSVSPGLYRPANGGYALCTMPTPKARGSRLVSPSHVHDTPRDGGQTRLGTDPNAGGHDRPLSPTLLMFSSP